MAFGPCLAQTNNRPSFMKKSATSEKDWAAEPAGQHVTGETGVYFRQWLKTPLSMGSVMPSAPALGRRVAANLICEPDEYVVEAGAGTGAITAFILRSGIAPHRVFAVELEADFTTHLRRRFPQINAIQGDARKLSQILPDNVVGKVGTVVCGIPLVMLPRPVQKDIVDDMLRLMPPGRHFLHYSYCITSPLPMRQLGLKGRRVGYTWKNLPPASLWAYWRD